MSIDLTPKNTEGQMGTTNNTEGTDSAAAIAAATQTRDEAADALKEARGKKKNTKAAKQALADAESALAALTGTEPTAEPEAETTAETTAEPAAETTAEPAAETTAEPAAETTAEPAAETTAEPAAETTAEPAAETTAEPAAEPTAEPTAEPVRAVCVVARDPHSMGLPVYETAPVVEEPEVILHPGEARIVTEGDPNFDQELIAVAKQVEAADAEPAAEAEPVSAKAEPPAVGSIVTGRVIAKVSDKEHKVYGLKVALPGGFSALLHVTQLDGGSRPAKEEKLRAIKVGDEVTAQVIEVAADQKRQGKLRIALSQQAMKQGQLKDELPGKVVEGTVSGLAQFGVFVNIGDGVRGLLHVSKMMGDTIPEHDARLASLEVGAKVTVKVTKVEEDPKRKGQLRITLSEQALQPRKSAEELMAELTGKIIEGTVVAIGEKDGARFGVFVGIGDGVRGLLHVSKMLGDSREEHDARLAAMQVGDKVTVKVVECNPDPKRKGQLRVSLSEQAVEADAYVDSLIGQEFKARPSEEDDRGFFFELRHGLTGFLPFSELDGANAERIRTAKKTWVKVVSVDGDLVQLTRRGLSQ